MTKIASVYKARPTTEPVENVTIEIWEDIPDTKDLNVAARLYSTDGNLLAHALLNSLPGGTVDQLLIALLKNRASLLRIPFIDYVGKD